MKPEEIELLLKAPAFLTILAIHHDGMLNPAEKKEAAKLTHIKTYSSPPELREYYQQVEKIFISTLDELESTLPPHKKERDIILRQYLDQVKRKFRKLNPGTQLMLYDSLKTYLVRVPRINKSIFEEILLPILIDFVDRETLKRSQRS